MQPQTALRVFEDRAQNIALAETSVAVDREARMVGNPVLQTQPAEPAVDQIRLHLLAQAPLRTDRSAVAGQKHPHHQLGTDRRAARMAVVGLQLAAQPAQVQNRVDLAQEMIARNHLIEIELIEKAVLPTTTPAHRPP